MRVRFWGARGSIPVCGPDVLRYGGCTACVEVRTDNGTLIVIDCGTGAYNLGQALASSGGPVSGHLLISHTHWDHIQGLPFFAPLFVAGNHWDIFGPHGVSQPLRETLAGQMQSAYFPVALEDLGAEIQVHELVEGRFQIGDALVATRFLNHPALTLSYRIEADGAALVYASDHEPHVRELAGGDGQVTGEDLSHAEFLRDADLVIHDAQFTPEEYLSRLGWGHSTGQYAARVCRHAGVRALALFHHDPRRGDEAVERIASEISDGLGPGAPLQVFAAAEGRCLEVFAGGAGTARAAKARTAAAQEPALLLQRPVVIGAADTDLAEAMADAVGADGLRVIRKLDCRGTVGAVAACRPALVLLEHKPGLIDGVATCRRIRALPESSAEQLPVLIVSAEDGRAAATVAGATEWLCTPVSQAYLQARARAWLLRQTPRWRRAEPPPDEEARLMALARMGLLESGPAEGLDRLTRLAAAAFRVPVALVTLMGRDRQHFKSRFGTELEGTHRDLSFCAHALHEDRPLIVPDTLRDVRFADNPMVVGEPRIRFYAGHPIHDADGTCLGTLCLVDMRPRDLGPTDLGMLDDLATLVREELGVC